MVHLAGWWECLKKGIQNNMDICIALDKNSSFKSGISRLILKRLQRPVFLCLPNSLLFEERENLPN